MFTAVARTDGGLRWTAVTIDSGDDAKAALDRINIPQDVLDRIAPTASPRSSIVISDEPLNRETNYRTEFVVVLNNQPQGGLAMRRPSNDVRVAGRRGWDDFFGPFLGQFGLPIRLCAPARRPELLSAAMAMVRTRRLAGRSTHWCPDSEVRKCLSNL